MPTDLLGNVPCRTPQKISQQLPNQPGLVPGYLCVYLFHPTYALPPFSKSGLCVGIYTDMHLRFYTLGGVEVDILQWVPN